MAVSVSVSLYPFVTILSVVVVLVTAYFVNVTVFGWGVTFTVERVGEVTVTAGRFCVMVLRRVGTYFTLFFPYCTEHDLVVLVVALPPLQLMVWLRVVPRKRATANRVLKCILSDFLRRKVLWLEGSHTRYRSGRS